MEYYLPLKMLHIISSTLLFGTGLGTAFFMWRADRGGELSLMAATAKSVVLADWVFTAPAVIIQPLSGLAMMAIAGIPITTTWIMWSLALYVLVGLCWLPVVWIQMRVAKLLNEAEQLSAATNDTYKQYMKWWYALGWPAFIAVMGVFYLMIFKPN